MMRHEVCEADCISQGNGLRILKQEQDVVGFVLLLYVHHQNKVLMHGHNILFFS